MKQMMLAIERRSSAVPAVPQHNTEQQLQLLNLMADAIIAVFRATRRELTTPNACPARVQQGGVDESA